jgi:polyphosphate glucokinase
VAEVLAEIVGHFRQEYGDESMPVGCGFPGVVKSGIVRTATHLDEAWLGSDVVGVFSEAVGSAVTVLNDADAAGLAEVRFGSAKGHQGSVLMITLGTGIGSGMLCDGRLIPNFEMGMLELGGHRPIEDRVAYRVYKQSSMSWKKWAKRLNRYLRHVNGLVAPDLIVIGGGGVNKWARYNKHLDVGVELKPALYGNHAGIVGAALAAVEPQLIGGRI